jgi:hypothetical protein
MTYELTNEEKAVIVNQRLKNVESNIFNLELSLIEENAVVAPNATNVSSLNAQLAEANAKKTALLAELSEVTA